MVGEFPEIQGVMGRYYAFHDGEPAPVCEAIADHYAPAGPSDDCPAAPLSMAVALADKIDTLVGFFAIGETPTGSKDPFALRRASTGVNRTERWRIRGNNVSGAPVMNVPPFRCWTMGFYMPFPVACP